MQAELFANVVSAIFTSIDDNRAVTDFIIGRLTDYEINSFEDTCFFKVELSSCNRQFRIWIVAQLHEQGFTGFF